MNFSRENYYKIDIKAGLALVCCLIFITSTTRGAEQDEDALSHLKQYIHDLDSYQANFKQVIYGQSGDVIETSTGYVRLQKPGRFYWVYQHPYSQYLVSNGNTLWIYDEDLQQVTINRIDINVSNSPAAILSGEIQIESNYAVADLGLQKGNNWIELTSTQDDVEFSSIRLGFQGDELAGMILFDNLGQITELSFTEVLRNLALDTAQFDFEPPEGIDIIDTR